MSQIIVKVCQQKDEESRRYVECLQVELEVLGRTGTRVR